MQLKAQEYDPNLHFTLKPNENHITKRISFLFQDADDTKKNANTSTYALREMSGPRMKIS